MAERSELKEVDLGHNNLGEVNAVVQTFLNLLLIAVELSLATLYVKVSKFSKKERTKRGQIILIFSLNSSNSS